MDPSPCKTCKIYRGKFWPKNWATSKISGFKDLIADLCIFIRTFIFGYLGEMMRKIFSF
jgi:hypothetical protein